MKTVGLADARCNSNICRPNNATFPSHRPQNRSTRCNAAHNEPSNNEEPLLWAPLASPPVEQPARCVPTQRGIPTFESPIETQDPCSDCQGTGKTTCGACKGKGRVNYRKFAMLPTGVWPEWCKECRATGKWICSACLGTGKRREPIGFRI